MDGSKVQYIVDEKGKPRSVVLSIAEYKRLLAKLEDAEDALALDEARRKTSSFTDFEKVKADLKNGFERKNEPALI